MKGSTGRCGFQAVVSVITKWTGAQLWRLSDELEDVKLVMSRYLDSRSRVCITTWEVLSDAEQTIPFFQV